MTTVTLPTVPPPPQSRDDPGRLPLPGRYTVASGRSLCELTAWYGPLPTMRRRVRLAAGSLAVPAESEHPDFSFEFDGTDLTATLTSERIDDTGGELQVTGDLDVNGVAFPVLLHLRVVERAEDRLLVVGHARLPYRLLRRATGFRLRWRRPASRLRLLVAAEFA
ncbi:YceI family protein [Streptomyces sp. NPDC050619]|uniref:YceI family protein n=1 Tax=Streptomyces sp. NPDC050619 TaxID=3157214 RepID=UPI003436EC5A